MTVMGHVKRNPATGAVAIRTRFDEELPEQARLAWMIAYPASGPRSATSDEVADWDDLFTPDGTEPYLESGL